MKNCSIPTRETKTSLIKARCAPRLKTQIYQLAAWHHLEASDIIRLALEDYVQRCTPHTPQLRG